MRTRRLLALNTCALILALTALSLPPRANVAAEKLWQGSSQLDGYQIYFSESLGEASRFDRSAKGLSRLAGLVDLLGADLYTLEWRTGIPADADLLVIAGPANDLSADQVAWLWAYLQNGGRLLLLADPPPAKALPATSGLFQLLWDDMGLRGRNDVVATEGELRPVVPPPAKVAADQPTPTPLPPVEIPALVMDFTTTTVNTFHPIAAGLEGELAFFGARSLEVDAAPRESQVTPVVYTDSVFYGESDIATYQQFQYVEYNVDKDTARGMLPLIAAMENIASGTRIVLIGDRDFATNGGGFETSPPYSGAFLHPGNVRFMLNAIAWLLDAEPVAGAVSFPEPGPTATPTLTPTPTPLPPPSPTPTAGQ